jgi:hypothetical protein
MIAVVSGPFRKTGPETIDKLAARGSSEKQKRRKRYYEMREHPKTPSNGSNGDNTKNLNEEIKVLKVDYDAYARKRGEEAEQTALAMGLPPDEVAEFRRVFGSPLDLEFRWS